MIFTLSIHVSVSGIVAITEVQVVKTNYAATVNLSWDLLYKVPYKELYRITVESVWGRYMMVRRFTHVNYHLLYMFYIYLKL